MLQDIYESVQTNEKKLGRGGGILARENLRKLTMLQMAFKINQHTIFYPYWTMEKCLRPGRDGGRGVLFGKEGDFAIPKLIYIKISIIIVQRESVQNWVGGKLG